MTYRLLFPSRDHLRLRKMIKERTHYRGYRPNDCPGDQELIMAYALKRNEQRFENVHNSVQLATIYPHWGLRLQLICEEAANPTPVTALSLWIDRRKSPGDTFWITAVAFSVAILFGIVSTVVGIIQIWIAYCDWRGGGRGMCWTGGE